MEKIILYERLPSKGSEARLVALERGQESCLFTPRVLESNGTSRGNYIPLPPCSPACPETLRPLTCTSSHLPLRLLAPSTQSKPQSALARIKELPEIPSVSIVRACACKRHIFACRLLVASKTAGSESSNWTGHYGAFKRHTQPCIANHSSRQSQENVCGKIGDHLLFAWLNSCAFPLFPACKWIQKDLSCLSLSRGSSKVHSRVFYCSDGAEVNSCGADASAAPPPNRAACQLYITGRVSAALVNGDSALLHELIMTSGTTFSPGVSDVRPFLSHLP